MEKQKQQKAIHFPKVTLGDVLKVIWQSIKPQKWLFFALIGSLVLSNITIIIIPIFYKQFFDVITVAYDKAELTGVLIKIIVYILILNVLFWILYRIATLSNNSYQPKVIANLKQNAYNYLMDHSYSFFTNSFAGSLVQKVNRLARSFERLSDRLLWDLLPLAIRVISILVILLFINKWISLLLLVWIIIFLAFNISFSRWKLKYDIKAAEIDSLATGYLADTIANQNSIQLFASANFEKKGYKKVTDEQAKTTRLAWNLDAVVEGGQAFLGIVIEFALFYFAIRYWQDGIITVGVFVLLQAYLLNIINQLWGFTRTVRDLYQGYADAKEMVEILKLPHEIQNITGAKELSVKKGQIEFSSVGFSFNKTRTVLNNVDLVIKPGEKVALIGPSGAGKTTFVRLLLRLYAATKGAILIDGQDIAMVTQESLRANIAMVPQEPVLFHRTLAENIAYGKKDATAEEVAQASKLAHCDEFIENLPYKLNTMVGERGIKLSGGERQRVAIARAILKNAPILILDEATSSLDSNSEALIQDALNNLMKNRTTIVIAHRLSTIQKMDRIIVIDEGKIIEQGNHNELLANENSLYKKLWTLQAGGFLEDEEGEDVDEVIDAEDEEDYDKPEPVSY